MGLVADSSNSGVGEGEGMGVSVGGEYVGYGVNVADTVGCICVAVGSGEDVARVEIRVGPQATRTSIMAVASFTWRI